MTEEHGELDPRSAAALLEQTTAQARRQFDLRPPLLHAGRSGGRACRVRRGLVVGTPTASLLGAKRDGPGRALHDRDHLGDRGRSLFRRATRGVGGRSSRQQKADALAFVPVWIAVYVFQGALHHAGASHAIVYGIYPAAAPLIIVGGAAAAHEAARENWHWVGFALAAVALAAAAAFTGPADVWAVIGIGLCVLLLVRAASQVWVRHA